MERSNTSISQELLLKDRKALTLNGVLNIEEFGDNFLALKTEFGDVCIEGSEMKIENLSKETGEILVVGRIDGFFFKTDVENKNWFSRIFK